MNIWDDPPQKVVIDSANLRSFFYRKAFRCALGSVSFSSCKLLTTLATECTEFGTVNAIDEYLSQIPLLENLTLKCCETPESIQISHSNLKSLKLQNCWPLSKAEINTPNLRFFQLHGQIIHLFTFRYCSGLLNAELLLGTGSFAGTEWFWFVKLRNFLESFSKCKLLSLTCCIEGFPEELRDNDMLPDPLCELRHLRIMSRKLPIAHYASFVDALVELFPCKNPFSEDFCCRYLH